MLMACDVCGGKEFGRFFQSREWCCSGHYLTDATAWSAQTPVPIRLDFCRDCGLIRQAPGYEVQLNYEEIGRDTARQLPDYTDRIIASLATFGVAPDGLVIEVGANDGTFLSALRAAGYRRLVGVEPSEHLAARASTAGLEIHNDFYGEACAARMLAQYGPAQAVICRHTLEHVPDVRDLMQGLAAILAPGGLCFLEVPDADWIVSKLFAHEIWDEHISYFRAGALTRLVRVAGLTPVRLNRIRFRDTCNLLCWSVRGAGPSRSPEDLPDDLAEDLTSTAELIGFQARWDAFSARLRDAVAAAPRPVVAVGASHIQLNFLNFTGLDRSVDLLIDDDPVKAGHYAPLATAVPIRTTSDILASLRTGTLLRTAFPYPAWEDRIIAGLAPHGVRSITPYDLS